MRRTEDIARPNKLATCSIRQTNNVYNTGRLIKQIFATRVCGLAIYKVDYNTVIRLYYKREFVFALLVHKVGCFTDLKRSRGVLDRADRFRQ